MFEAFVLVCYMGNVNYCKPVKDTRGPYEEIQMCHSRLEEMKDDLINAGAIYTDLPAVVDKNIITTAHYKDMGPWMKAVIEKIN